MLISNESNARSGQYEGFLTHLLVGELNSGSKEISIQITTVNPGAMQFLHDHPQEQCYYIIEGQGQMIIDEENKEVASGDAIYIPSGATHGIKNIGATPLRYLTANKSFGRDKENELWSRTPDQALS